MAAIKAKKEIYYPWPRFEQMARNFGFEARVMWERKEKDPHQTFPHTACYTLHRVSDGRWTMILVQGGKTEHDGFTIYACQPMASYESAMKWAVESVAAHTQPTK